MIGETTTVDDFVSALKAVGLKADVIIGVLQAVEKAGALFGSLVDHVDARERGGTCRSTNDQQHITSTRSTPLAGRQKPAIDKNGELYKACQDFEALFIKQMLDAMRKTIDKSDDMLGGGMSQDVFEGHAL